MTIFTTMPAGSRNIVEARALVDAAMFGKGWRQLDLILPTLVHAGVPELPLETNSVFIGVPCFGSDLRPTAWCNPFEVTAPAGGAYEEYAAWLLQRNDIEEFVRPLFGKTLLCSCEQRGPCHGELLVTTCVRVRDFV